MRSEAFYTTVAQVLPTLLIAFVLEIRPVMRETFSTRERREKMNRRILHRQIDILMAQKRRHAQDAKVDKPSSAWEAAVRRALESRSSGRRQERRDALLKRTMLTTFGFSTFLLLGEGCALAVLLTGTKGWTPLVAGPICAFAVLASAAAVVWIAYLRLKLDRDDGVA